MPTYQNPDGSFFCETFGGPITLVADPADASVVKMDVTSRSLFVNASLMPSLTVWLPPVEPGEKVELCFETGVTALLICDSVGAIVTSAPTSSSGPGASIIMRFISRDYGWFFWSGGAAGSTGGSTGNSVTLDGQTITLDGQTITSL